MRRVCQGLGACRAWGFGVQGFKGCCVQISGFGAYHSRDVRVQAMVVLLRYHHSGSELVVHLNPGPSTADALHPLRKSGIEVPPFGALSHPCT